jgi:hypothetical protein
MWRDKFSFPAEVYETQGDIRMGVKWNETLVCQAITLKNIVHWRFKIRIK